MPSWKKVIVSGSSAALPSITHTGDFTIDASGDIILDADGTDTVSYTHLTLPTTPYV